MQNLMSLFCLHTSFMAPACQLTAEYENRSKSEHHTSMNNNKYNRHDTRIIECSLQW